ncbi:MAG: DUF1284 domain-containing protein [Ruminococcus sp.]|jgi:hypothetical protein|nr:DUF1284 domain-containing protein [Ruminococcus sp.]
MDLRPHHLLCTQGYSGKGYSEDFVENMDRLTERLRGEEPITVRLKFSTDDLCMSCPHMLGTDLCRTNEKVKQFDRKVVEYFHLEEKEYIYQELVQKIRQEMTPKMLEDICDGCSWYPVSACREIILGKK